MSTASAAKPRHIPVREDWLALGVEPAIEPSRPIVDAHHHLWDKAEAPYLLSEFRADLSTGHHVAATVFVEGGGGYRRDDDPALRSLGETEMAAAIAAESEREPVGPRIAAGLVGFVDLTLGDRAGEVLDLHVKAAGGRFRGVRNTSAWHEDPEARGSVRLPPPGVLYDAAFRDGLAALTNRGLVFDAWMYHTQLSELADLASDFADTTFVLNHQGGPIGIGPYGGRRAEVFEDWRRGMERLARCDNVHVKLGGFGMFMAGFNFHERPRPPTSDQLAAAWAPYMNTCIELFGPSRCMFESNFPVDKGTTSYGVLWNAFKKIADIHTEPDKQALFFETANRVYNLGLRHER